MKLKKILAVVLSVVILIGNLTACDFFNNSGEKESETIQFDLSEYESHGELSCGRIWCSVIEGDWQTPNKEKFAYFDCYGNQISQWFDMETYNGPEDYNNNFAVLTQIETPPERDYYPVTIVDIDGETTNLWVKYHHYGGAPYLGISEFNSDGMACCYAWDENYEDTLYWLDDSGAHKFNIDDDDIVRSYSPDSMYVEKLDGYVVLYLGGSYNYYTAIFFNSGMLALDVREAIGGYEIEKVSKDGENFKVTFEGADDKTYNCIVDIFGEFVKKPY